MEALLVAQAGDRTTQLCWPWQAQEVSGGVPPPQARFIGTRPQKRVRSIITGQNSFRAERQFFIPLARPRPIPTIGRSRFGAWTQTSKRYWSEAALMGAIHPRDTWFTTGPER